ncbi:MAG TPA: hypothetical protein VJ836_01105 [Candidatus Saccharimonadales bacterium]|nr:hypothetical protein [Candidatus Saccharimonadales bacterium]
MDPKQQFSSSAREGTNSNSNNINPSDTSLPDTGTPQPAEHADASKPSSAPTVSEPAPVSTPDSPAVSAGTVVVTPAATATNVKPSTPPPVSADEWAPAEPTAPLTNSVPDGTPSPYGAAASSEASVATTTSPTASRKKLWILGGIVTLIVMLLLGAGAAAYFGYYAANKPQNILGMALANEFDKRKIQSEHFEGRMDITGKQDSDDMTFSGTFSGAATQEGALDLNVSVDVMVSRLILDVRSADGKSYFLKVSGLTGLPEIMGLGDSPEVTQLYAPILAAINNQWFEINESLIKEMTGGGTTLTDADRQKIVDAYKQHQFLVVKEKMADEEIQGRDSYHLKVGIDEAILYNFVVALKDAKLESIKLDNDNVKSFKEALDKNTLDKYIADVWITKAEKFISQVALKFDEKDMSGEIRYTVKEHNKPVKVEKPEGAKSVLELMSQLYGGNTEDLLKPQQGALMEELEAGISL